MEYCTPPSQCKKKYFCQRNFFLVPIKDKDKVVEKISGTVCMKHEYIHFLDVKDKK